MLRRLLPLALLFALLPASASAKTVTCKSGHTVVSRGHARLFTKKSTFSNGIYSRLYVCSLTVRHPLEIDSDRDYAEARWGQWYASGRYVAYINSWADAVAGGWMLRSVDLATGEVRWREIVDGTGISADNPLAVRIDRDGSMAFLATGYEPHKAVIGWVRNGVYAMHAPRVLKTLDEAVAPDSLAFQDGVVSWKTVAGATDSVRLG